MYPILTILFSVFKRQASTTGHAFQCMLKLLCLIHSKEDELKFAIAVILLEKKKNKKEKGMEKWQHLGK